MKCYDTYKDCEIPWIDSIPESWIVRRGKTILRLLDRPVAPDDEIITCFRDGEVTLRRNRREEGFTISLQENGYQGIEPGDLVVHGMDGFAGAIGVSDSRGKATPVLNVMDSSQNKKYLMYYLRALAYRDVFMSLSTGIRVRSCDLRWNKLAVLPFVVPSLQEQEKIAAYLDDKISQIDSIIVEAQNSIEEYKRWKLSIINNAVTKGLDGDVLYKDSDIPSFGMVPETWKTIRLKNILSLRNIKSGGKGELLSVYLDRGVISYRDSSGQQVHKPSLDLSNYQIVEIGDFVLNNQQAWRGSVGISEYKGIISPAYYVYRIVVDCNYRYMNYVLRDLCMVQQYETASRGVGTIQRNIYSPWLLNARIAIPPINEQTKIASFLDRKCEEIDAVISEKQELINDLEMFRRSLVYETVTGKRKVV